ncbi:MAG: hypothetical protein L0G58_09410 [Acinetobacter sp.]|nr:hypothetical protein [Acinetobacter sp.]MDN5556817.1 hypothetical protein [Acinetobacter sp.]
MRDHKRLVAVRLLPCIRCGNPNSQADHSNSAKHGKGRGIKSSDLFTVPICVGYHQKFYRFELGTQAKIEAMFDRWLVKTNRILQMEDREVF